MQKEKEYPNKIRTMFSHQSSNMISDTWLTPPDIIKSLGEFDLDPCSPIHRPWGTAAEHYDIRDDGLIKKWHGRVWLNPPYSREAIKWLRKLSNHGYGTALIFARTETAWFFEAVWSKATAILFIKGRIHFHLADGSRAKANAGAPSCLVAYGEHDAILLRDCGIEGYYLKINHD